MPTYQYACAACGEQVEAVQKFTDDPLTECPACGGKLRKVFSPVGIVFKGSGFYRTDSRSGPVTAQDKNTKAKTNGSADSSSPDGGDGGKKTDTASSKPATGETKKTESKPAPASAGAST